MNNNDFFSYDNFVEKEKLLPYCRYEFMTQLVFGALAGRAYERGWTGDSLNIVTPGKAKVSNYQSYSQGSTGQKLNSTVRKITITQDIEVTISAEAYDLQRAAAIALQREIADAGSLALANAIDQYVAGFYWDIWPDHIIGSDDNPIDLTSDRRKIRDLFAYVNKIFNDIGVPLQGRYVTGAGALTEALQRADIIPTQTADQRYINGLVTNTLGLSIRHSTAIPITPKGNRIIIFGYNKELSNNIADPNNIFNNTGGLRASTQLVIPFKDMRYEPAHNTSRYDLFMHYVFGGVLSEPKAYCMAFVKETNSFAA